MTGEKFNNRNFRSARIFGENFEDSTFSDCDFRGAEIRKSNFKRTGINSCDFYYSSLHGSDFSYALIVDTRFKDARLRDVSFRGATLRNVDFFNADLKDTDFRDVKLSNVNFFDANLSGAKGLPSSSDFLKKLEKTDEGFIVYKAFSTSARMSIFQAFPPHWPDLAEGVVLEEVCNPDRTLMCGCGVNFGTYKYCADNFGENTMVWRCLIEWDDAAEIVVPYAAIKMGTARCSRLRLIERVRY